MDRKILNQAFDAAKEEAERHGGRIEIEQGGKHLRMIVHYKGRIKKITVSGSPRTNNQCNWFRQDVRRAIRGMS